MFLSPSAFRSRRTAVSTACGSAALPGRARSSSLRATTDPGRNASARRIAIIAGDSDCTVSSTVTPYQLIEFSAGWCRHPSVCPDSDDVGVRGTQLVEELGKRVPVVGCAVHLHGYPTAADAGLFQVVRNVAGGLRFRAPLFA